jgi:O-acetyl-ADP-ribose deacetylase (regulator of RNase III)
MAWNEEDHLIMNLATQDHPGPHARVEWIRQSVEKMVTFCHMEGVGEAAICRVGTGIGGLDWEEVKMALGEVVPGDFNLVVYCLDP